MKVSEATRLAVRDITDLPETGSPAEQSDPPGHQREQITLHFSLALESGELVDSNFDAAPVSFCPGDGNLLPGFEAVVLGLEAGSEVSVVLPPVQAFGLRSEDNLQVYPAYQFPASLALTEGLMVAFRDAAGNEQAGVVRSISRTGVEVDFNHPLAGKSIIFRVHVIERSTIRE